MPLLCRPDRKTGAQIEKLPRLGAPCLKRGPILERRRRRGAKSGQVRSFDAAKSVQ